MGAGRLRGARAGWLGGGEAEEEAVGGDSGGTGDEHRHAGRRGRDRLREAGAVEAADGAELLARIERQPAGDVMIREPMKLLTRQSVARP